jgi:hypothetical protein
MYLAVIVIFLASMLMLVVMLTTDILLDPNIVGGVKSYSLAKTQLAIWILIVFCSWVYVLGNTLPGGSDGVGRTSLLLLGISSSVTLIGRVIDRTEMQNFPKRDEKHRHRDIAGQRSWKNIIAYAKPIGFPRLQYVAVNLWLAIEFIYAISGKMPELDCNRLILLCVSSIYYLGVKRKK